MNTQLTVTERAKNIRFTNSISIEKSSGSRIYCTGGQAYIDFCSQHKSNLLGHNIKILRECIIDFNIANQYNTHLAIQHQAVTPLSQHLVIHLPNPDTWDVEYFDADNCALDRALQSALTYWQCQKQHKRTTIITFAHCHHGNTLNCKNFNASFVNHNPFQDFLLPTEHLPYPNTWYQDANTEHKETLALQRLENFLAEKNHTYAAILLEPLLQTHNGMIACRPSFLNKVIQAVRKYDILVISDERYLSPLRSGEFYASNHLAYHPDIIVLGQTLTNGICPIGITLTQKSIFDKIDRINFFNSGQHINHFAGTIALQTLRILEQYQETQHVNALQKVHEKRVHHLDKQPIIKNIRYLGAICAFDIICDDQSQRHKLLDWFYKKCRNSGIILPTQQQSICLSPPLCLSTKDLNYTYDCFEEAIRTIPLKYITNYLD